MQVVVLIRFARRAAARTAVAGAEKRMKRLRAQAGSGWLWRVRGYRSWV